MGDLLCGQAALREPVARPFEFRLFETVRGQDRNSLAVQFHENAPCD
jgi:hypothetical protein